MCCVCVPVWLTDDLSCLPGPVLTEVPTAVSSAAKALLDYGFANYTLAEPKPEEIPAVPVVLGQEAQIVPVPADETPLLIEKGLQNSVATQVEVAEQVRAPVEAGQRLGTMTIRAGDTVLVTVPLVAPNAVARRSWWDVTKGLLQAVCFG